MPGKRQAKRKASMPRTIGMVIFRILAIGVWIFALLIFVGGLSTDFLTCTIIALIIAFVGWMLWVVGDMIHDPEKIRAEQRAARAAKDPSIVLDEDNEHERKRAANGHWDGRANHGHAQPNDETSPALAGVEVEDGEALASRNGTKFYVGKDDIAVADHHPAKNAVSVGDSGNRNRLRFIPCHNLRLRPTPHTQAKRGACRKNQRCYPSDNAEKST